MGYFPKGGINTERKRSNKGGSEFVHFGKLSYLAQVEEAGKKKIILDTKKLISRAIPTCRKKLILNMPHYVWERKYNQRSEVSKTPWHYFCNYIQEQELQWISHPLGQGLRDAFTDLWQISSGMYL